MMFRCNRHGGRGVEYLRRPSFCTSSGMSSDSLWAILRASSLSLLSCSRTVWRDASSSRSACSCTSISSCTHKRTHREIWSISLPGLSENLLSTCRVSAAVDICSCVKCWRRVVDHLQVWSNCQIEPGRCRLLHSQFRTLQMFFFKYIWQFWLFYSRLQMQMSPHIQMFAAVMYHKLTSFEFYDNMLFCFKVGCDWLQDNIKGKKQVKVSAV